MSFPEFTRFAHQRLTCNTPMGPQRLVAILDVLALEGSERVVDVGCGVGEFSLKLAEHGGVSVVGLDPDTHALAEAEARRERRGLRGEVEFLETTAADFFSEPRQADLVVCLGVQHAFGSFEAMLDLVAGSLSPGGRVWIGDGYWRGELDPAYEAFLGGVKDRATFEDRVRSAVDRGWTPLYASEVSLDEWDQFEWAFFRVAESYARLHPDDPRAAELLEKRTAWRDAYLRWGRGVMGFGYFILRRPED